MRELKSSRADSEKKGKVTSVRLTEEQHRRVQEQAKAKGMTISSYIITTAVNGGNAITPEMLVEMQNVVNMACAVVEECVPEKVESIQERMNEIWQKLV